jgi:hypothetical protein
MFGKLILNICVGIVRSRTKATEFSLVLYESRSRLYNSKRNYFCCSTVHFDNIEVSLTNKCTIY